jgi:hypothetical protein
MTDDEIREVFAEFHRIGVDLGKPPGLAIGTGFRDGELLAWLRSLPDGFGHDAFAARLASYVNDAQPNAADQLPRRADAAPHRFWPTVEQLNGAIDVLVAEWDPLGARLGTLPREAVMHHAQNVLGAIMHGGEPDRIERRVSAQLASIENEVFGVRPSPREQRRYLARRLIQVVVDQPGPAHDENPWDELFRAAEASKEIARAEGRLRETGSSTTVCFGPRGDEPSALDATALCTECGAVGTVAFVGRENEPRYSRFCVACWSNVRDKFWVFPKRHRLHVKPEDHSSPEELVAAFDQMAADIHFMATERVRAVGSAMWEDHAPLIDMALVRPDRKSDAEHARDLAQLAEQTLMRVPTMYGPMPPAIESFVRQYARPDTSPASASDKHEPPATNPQPDA